MLYLVAQTALFILAAGAVGLWLGWYLGGLSRDQEFNGLDNRLRGLRRDRAGERERAATAERQAADCAKALAQCEQARRTLEEQVKNREPAAAAAAPPDRAPALPPADGAADDLQRIKGIGPRLSALLNELGVCQYRQIAAFTPDDIAWINDRLRFPGRIQRERWVEQARTLSRR